MLSDACVISQKTGLELRKVCVWLYKHEEPVERIVRYSRASGWDKISECIKKDRPLEWLVAGAALDTT
jgi:hypothetical protein